MYQQFFGLARMPFQTTPDTRFFFHSEQHEEALSTLIYAVSERKGLVLLTGEAGAGKTTVARALLNRIDPATQVAVLTSGRLSGVELLQAVCEEFRLWVPGEVGRVTLQTELKSFLSDEHRLGHDVILVVDEAQELSHEALEEVRLLSNHETERDKLLQIILLGRPELNTALSLPESAALKQRIVLRYDLAPLTEKDAGAYVVHRLKIAGADGSIRFSRGALGAVHAYARGLPRVINIVCDNVLLTAFVGETRRIGAAMIEEVVAELEGAS